MGNEQKRMEVFGFLKDEGISNRTVCTPFLQHCSSRSLKEEQGVGIIKIDFFYENTVPLYKTDKF